MEIGLGKHIKYSKETGYHLLIKEQMSMIDEISENFGVGKASIIREVHKPFDEFNSAILSILLDRSKSKLKNDTLYVQKALVMLSHYWALENGKMFAMEINKALALPDIDLNSIDFDKIQDYYVFFYDKKLGNTNIYGNVMIDPYDIAVNGRDMTLYGLGLGTIGENGLVYQAHIARELYPRIMNHTAFKQIDLLGMCNECQYKNKIQLRSKVAAESFDTCLVGKSLRRECNMFKVSIDPCKLLNIMGYVANSYNNRAEIAKASTKKRNKIGYTSEIDVLVKEQDGKRTRNIFVPLTTYERKEVATNSSVERIKGTHESPREHTRREHTRRYKNGKVITVSETIINKGKEKVIYDIK